MAVILEEVRTRDSSSNVNKNNETSSVTAIGIFNNRENKKQSIPEFFDEEDPVVVNKTHRF